MRSLLPLGAEVTRQDGAVVPDPPGSGSHLHGHGGPWTRPADRCWIGADDGSAGSPATSDCFLVRSA